jgi:hypothetical protein
MITELAFIRSYNTFWRSLFPGAENYIRLINSSLGLRFANHLNIIDIAKRRALINGISFSLFEMNAKKGITLKTIENFKTNDKLLEKISSNEKKALSDIMTDDVLADNINNEELEIIKSISQRLILEYSAKETLKIRPKLKGCGILFETNGDIIYEETLTEIKAGDRNFSVQDLRQLYVYLSLNYESKEFDLQQIELCNPRTGILWRENIEIVSENIGGCSSTEIYNEIINFLSNDIHSL